MKLSAQKRLDRITKDLTEWHDAALKQAKTYRRLSRLKDGKARHYLGGSYDQTISRTHCLHEVILAEAMAKALDHALKLIVHTGTMKG